jgi:hypothetical protein
MLSQYISETRLLLNDMQGQFFPDATVRNYVNRSRRRIAYVSGCIRVLPSGIKTHPMQEAYPFHTWTSAAQSALPGVQSILHCRSLAVSIGVGGWKPTWRRTVWTDFQARFRIYAGTFYGTVSEPGWWAQYGEGPSGRLFLAPIPSQENPMEPDLTCIPSPLLSDDDPEPIPMPWTDAVCYWAAILCLLQQQRQQDALGIGQLFNSDLPAMAAAVCPTFIANPYGATLRSA